MANASVVHTVFTAAETKQLLGQKAREWRYFTFFTIAMALFLVGFWYFAFKIMIDAHDTLEQVILGMFLPWANGKRIRINVSRIRN